jgi:hypothetical protein
MALWVTHLMVADGVLKHLPGLNRRGFCVGNIAPDCNVENEDWTAFIPPKEVTHWMQSDTKKAADCEAFCKEYIWKRRDEVKSEEEYAFLLGYYAHLIVDVAFQVMILDEERVKEVWKRIRAAGRLSTTELGLAETWAAVKSIIPKAEKTAEFAAVEAEYLAKHPDSGYLTEILPLQNFPDYIDYLPKGGIVRKIGVMGGIPVSDKAVDQLITVSKEEYEGFVEDAVQLVLHRFRENQLV